MKKKRKKKTHKDKNGREFIKETFFVGGKMKSRRVYVIDGTPMEEFYRKNASDLDFFLNQDYELMSQNDHSHHKKSDSDDFDDIPF